MVFLKPNFKTMKKTLILYLTGIMTVILIGCMETDEPGLFLEVKRYEMIQTNLSGQVIINQFHSGILTESECCNLQNCMTGSGKCNESNLKDFEMESNLSLTIAKSGSDSQIMMENGSFKFLNEEENSIFGSFSGCGEVCQRMFKADLIFKIEGGEGYFKDAYGELICTIGNFSNKSDQLILQFYGTVKHKKLY
jgi:hypothetical protein